MTPASLVNGEANFEWRPAEKATTQLITHVTSETAKKYIYRQTPANSVIAEHHLTWTHHLATKREKKSRSSPEIYYTVTVLSREFENLIKNILGEIFSKSIGIKFSGLKYSCEVKGIALREKTALLKVDSLL